MPRNNGIYSPPPGTGGTPLTPISSAMFNAFVADIAADQNAPRPVIAGGTGSATSQGAIDAFFGAPRTIIDEYVLFVDKTNHTKGARLDAGGVTAGQTRVLSMPDRDIDLGLVLPVGTTANTVAAGDDGRFSDAREWTAEIVTQAEAEAGESDDPKKWTSERVRQNAAAIAIGVGQTWQDMKATRSSGTTYTNTTKRPIQIAVSARQPSGSSAAKVELTVDGQTITNTSYALGSYATVSVIVPPGATYRAVLFPTAVSEWIELR